MANPELALRNGLATRMSVGLATAVAAVAGIGKFNGEVQAAPLQGTTTDYLADRCGGEAPTKSILVRHWGEKGILDDVVDYYNIPTVDEDVSTYVKNHFGRAILASDADVENTGCSVGTNVPAEVGRIIPVGNKHMEKGQTEWVYIDSLKAEFPEGFSLTPVDGYKRVVREVREGASDESSNPRRGRVRVFVYVKPQPAKPAPPPVEEQPKPVPVTLGIQKNLYMKTKGGRLVRIAVPPNKFAVDQYTYDGGRFNRKTGKVIGGRLLQHNVIRINEDVEKSASVPEGSNILLVERDLPKYDEIRPVKWLPNMQGDKDPDSLDRMVRFDNVVIKKKPVLPKPPTSKPKPKAPITTEILKSLVTEREFPTLVPDNTFKFLMQCISSTGEITKQAWFTLNHDRDPRPEYFRQRGITCASGTARVTSRERDLPGFEEVNPYVAKIVRFADNDPETVDVRFQHKNVELEGKKPVPPTSPKPPTTQPPQPPEEQPPTQPKGDEIPKPNPNDEGEDTEHGNGGDDGEGGSDDLPTPK